MSTLNYFLLVDSLYINLLDKIIELYTGSSNQEKLDKINK